MFYMEIKRLPYCLECFILGLSSILCSPIFIGLCFGIYGLILAKRSKLKQAESSDAYYGRELFIAGNVLSILGLILSGIVVLLGLIIGIVFIIGKGNPEVANEIVSYLYIIIGMLNQ